jgi:DNA-binding NarL/FixJ family response regulator
MRALRWWPNARDADDLLLKVASYELDVVIVDIRLPPTHRDEGLKAAFQIRAEKPSIGVLFLSQCVELGLAVKLLAESAEGAGYLLKDRISDVDEFVDAVRRVANGGSAVDPIIVSTLLNRQRPDDPLAQLTPREREVLELMATGSSNQGIADRLVITLRSVEKYVSTIFGKLGLPSSGSESRRVLAVFAVPPPLSAGPSIHQKTAPPIGVFAGFPDRSDGERLDESRELPKERQ